MIKSSYPDLLYLGFTFPPGVAATYPALNSFSHWHHAKMIHELERYFRIESINTLPFVAISPPGSDPMSGLDSQLTVVDQAPHVIHQRLSAWRIQEYYRKTYGKERQPQAVFVYNLSPIYNHFVRWLRRQPARPKLILHFEDSPRLGKGPSGWKRFRYRLKPMYYPDDQMIGLFDGCVGVSRPAERHFKERGIPYLWLPGACDTSKKFPPNPPAAEINSNEPIRFGYFGALSPYAGVLTLAESFLASNSCGTLDICGYGKLSDPLAVLAKRDSRLRFRGLLDSPDDCLRFGASCDVLVNPRPDSHGNENNFPSKVFQYALCGRAILTTRMGGVDSVFGHHADYLETDDLRASLRRELEALAARPRSNHWSRGEALRAVVATDHSYETWAAKAAEFIRSVRT